MRPNRSIAALVVFFVSAVALLTTALGRAQGGPPVSATHAALWTAFDANKNGRVTRAE